MDYIWYVGYGSNLNEQRFICYIKGGTPRFGKRKNDGCKDRTLPAENKSIIIHYPLYFALPNNLKETFNWGRGGVAFIGHAEDKELKTFCRMWKITREQYEEVRNQEGRSWYGKEIPLGENGGMPIYTITNEAVLSNIICPSDAYLKTIALGLKETYNFSEEEIADYLIAKEGIKDSLKKDNLIKIIGSL
jgi:hypothetical protein